MTKNSTNDQATSPISFAEIDNVGGSDVLLLDNLIPISNNSYTLGSATNRFSTLFASTVETSSVTSAGNVNFNPTSDVTTQKIVRPLLDNVTTLGTAIRRWSTTFSTNVNTDNLTSTGDVNINPGGTIVIAKDMRPDVTTTRSLGSSTFKYSNMHSATTTINNLNSDAATILVQKPLVRQGGLPLVTLGQTGNQWPEVWADQVLSNGALSFSAGAASAVFVNPLILPLFDNSCDIGSSGARFRKLWCVDADVSNTITTPRITTATGGLTLTTASGVDSITSERPIVPNSDIVHTIGTNSLRYLRVHALNFMNSASQTYTTFVNQTGTLSSTSFIDMPIASIANANFTGGAANTFKVPSNGLYRFEFTSSFNTVGSDTRVYYTLNQDGAPIWGIPEQIVGGAYAVANQRIVITFEVLSNFATISFRLRTRISAGSATSNVFQNAFLIRETAFN